MPTLIKVGEQTTELASTTALYTMRELNQNTARVMDEINRSGRPAAITKHGRFVALITPLGDAAIESVVLRHGPLAAEVERRACNPDPATAATTEEMLERLKTRYEE